MDETQQNLFNQINAKFENKLNYVENISSGISNFVIKVKKDDVIYALRIPIPTTKKEDKENIIKSYKNISILYNFNNLYNATSILVKYAIFGEFFID